MDYIFPHDIPTVSPIVFLQKCIPEMQPRRRYVIQIRQKMFIVEINNYAYLVPFVENEKEIFLKTIIPSRKATKEYLKGKDHEI